MGMTEVKNFNDLTEKILDKQDSLLSMKEVQQLNAIKPADYKMMKEQIANKTINWE